MLGTPSTMEFKTDLTLNMYGSAERRRDAQQEQFRKTDPKGAVIEWFPMYNDRTQMNAAGRAMAGLSANDNRAAGKGEVNWGDPLARESHVPKQRSPPRFPEPFEPTPARPLHPPNRLSPPYAHARAQMCRRAGR